MSTTTKRLYFLAGALSLFVLAATSAPRAEEPKLKPFLIAEPTSVAPASLKATVASVDKRLRAAGFDIAGQFSPYEGAHIFIITNNSLKKIAAQSITGGFGTAQRVAVTQVGDQVQVSATNPAWMANVYRLNGDLADVSAALQQALGCREEFGHRDGRTAQDLRSYHYKILMPHFDDQVTLAEYSSHAEALAKVEAGLAASAEVSQVSRIDIPGTEETLFSVAILAGDGADTTVMNVTDTGELKHTAHLSYELLVSGKQALMLHGKFRIAQSFPNLSLGTFMKIRGAPGGIEDVLRAAIK